MDALLTKLGRAPLVVVVSAVRATTTAIPWVEQLAACAAACQNALLAATALGYGSMWRTGEPCYDARVKAALGRGDDDAVVGFLYFGTLPESSRMAKGPREPNLEGLVEVWPGTAVSDRGRPTPVGRVGRRRGTPRCGR